MASIRATFIASVETQDTGGNCKADVIILKCGKAVVISDEALGIFDNPNDFLNTDGNGEIENCRDLDDGNGFERCETSAVGLTFIRSFELFEPDGPVSVDLLTLPDGRVIGIDSETIVIYPSRREFDAIETGVTADYPSLAIEGGAQ